MSRSEVASVSVVECRSEVVSAGVVVCRSVLVSAGNEKCDCGTRENNVICRTKTWCQYCYTYDNWVQLDKPFYVGTAYLMLGQRMRVICVCGRGMNDFPYDRWVNG